MPQNQGYDPNAFFFNQPQNDCNRTYPPAEPGAQPCYPNYPPRPCNGGGNVPPGTPGPTGPQGGMVDPQRRQNLNSHLTFF